MDRPYEWKLPCLSQLIFTELECICASVHRICASMHRICYVVPRCSSCPRLCALLEKSFLVDTVVSRWQLSSLTHFFFGEADLEEEDDALVIGDPRKPDGPGHDPTDPVGEVHHEVGGVAPDAGIQEMLDEVGEDRADRGGEGGPADGSPPPPQEEGGGGGGGTSTR